MVHAKARRRKGRQEGLKPGSGASVVLAKNLVFHCSGVGMIHHVLQFGAAFLLFGVVSVFASSPVDELVGIDSISAVEPCFSAPFDDHESWLKALSAENQHFDETSFKDRAPESEFERYSERLECAFFRYEVDGFQIGGYLVAPKGQDQLPIILFNRGGTADYGRMNFSGLYLSTFWLADAGYAVIGTQYRGGMGLPPEIGGVDERGGADVKDVLALLPIARQLDFVDADRLAMFAGSRGSINMFRASLEIENLKTMVSKSGIYDLEHGLEFRPRMERIYRKHIPGFDSDREAVLAKRSVVEWTEELDRNVPILLLHGAYDERASATGALGFALKLQERWHPYRLVMFENGDHFLSEHTAETRETVLGWFNRYLR